MAKDDQGRDLQKHTLNLFAGDFERLGELWPEPGASRVVRHMVRDLIKRTEGERANVEVDLRDAGVAE